MEIVVGSLIVVVALLSTLVLGLLRSHAEILRRLHALDGGEASAMATATPVALRTRADVPGPGTGDGVARDISGAGLHDDVVLVGAVGVAHRTLLAFLSSTCLTCHEFWTALGAKRLGLPDDVRVVIVTKAPDAESISAIRALAPIGVTLVMSSDAWIDYSVPGSPYFVLIDGVSRRVVGEGTGVRWDQVRSLFDQSMQDAADPHHESRIDRELLAAGIGPGDASLYEPGESSLSDPDAR